MSQNQLFGDYWWRFSRYEILDGYIRPAKGASLERYRPWLEYDALKGKGSVPRPYSGLVELSREFDEHSSGWELTDKEESLILDWCNTHGLLGVLLHQVEMVLMRDRESELGWRRYTRTARGWTREETNLRRTEHPRRPGVWLRTLGTFRWEFEPLSRTWSRFFPEVPKDQCETFRYPLPSSDEFWKRYAEPVDAFLNAAHQIRRAVKDLSGIELSDKTSKQDKYAWQNAQTAMHSLTSTVRYLLYPKDRGKYGLGWNCDSLLSVLAMMATLDLAQGRILSCRRCKRLFASQASQARYCSTRCRHSEQMTRYRKHRAEKEARKEQHAKKKTRKP